jgi:hypothetical protein
MSDQDCLRAALDHLGYGVKQDTLVRGFSGRVVQAALVVQPGGTFDIGFVRQADGSFACLADWWGVEREAGLREDKFLPPVMQRYAYEVVCRQLVHQGFQLVRESVARDGSVQLTLQRWP